MHTATLTSRRRFLSLAGSLAAGISLPGIPASVIAAETKEGKGKESVVNPVEDLMRGHGVLRRVLLVYEEAMNRINRGEGLPYEVIADSAGIIHRFVEDCHERLEEEEIFPRFKKAGKLEDLVNVLTVQHQAGRSLTDSILKLLESYVRKTPNAKQDESAAMRQIYGGTPLFQWKGSKQELSSTIRQFIHMYRPHAAREDTVLFSAFRSVVSPGEFDELSKRFEDREKELFGKDGLEKTLDSLGDIEKKLGIHDLSKFTPKA